MSTATLEASMFTVMQYSNANMMQFKRYSVYHVSSLMFANNH